MNKNNWTGFLVALIVWLGMGCVSLYAEVTVTNVSVQQRWPWNGLVDITYSIECDEMDKETEKEVYVMFTGIDNVRNHIISMTSLTGNGAHDSVKNGGPYTVTWNAGKDYPNFNSDSFQVKIQAMAGLLTYMVIDLSGGSSTTQYPVHFTKAEPNITKDTCRTTELWLRRIPAGTFTMGADNSEKGFWGNESPKHQVTISRVFYIGIFECTQKQWELVMGSNPSETIKYDWCPVDHVSFNMIRGSSSTGGGGWPASKHAVDTSSFMGKIREKTGLIFDLPTEAEWEYSCRAGATTALNSGKNLINISGKDENMNEVGRYPGNRYDERGGKGLTYYTKVGSYKANNWGIYDMHGNVREWVLDWTGKFSSAPVTDPVGPSSGARHWMRGGDYTYGPQHCRSSARMNSNQPGDRYGDCGFRVVCLVSP